MARITVLGGTGYAGSAIVAEAAARGHEVTSLSRSLPSQPIPGVRYVQGDVADVEALARVIEGTEVVVSALAPRGPLAAPFREVSRAVARLTAAAGARLYLVGGFSSLRPAPGADRYVSDLSGVPAALHPEITQGAAVVIEDLPSAPEALDWVFVSPAAAFGAYQPGERLGRYRLGDDVAVQPDGGAISAPDYALGFLDLIEAGDRHRAHVNLGNSRAPRLVTTDLP
jgi:hypothetical protein